MRKTPTIERGSWSRALPSKIFLKKKTKRKDEGGGGRKRAGTSGCRSHLLLNIFFPLVGGETLKDALG